MLPSSKGSEEMGAFIHSFNQHILSFCLQKGYRCIPNTGGREPWMGAAGGALTHRG